MKIQHPALMWAVGKAGAALVRGWMRTLRIRIVAEDPATDPRRGRGPYIYAIWHEAMLVPAFLFGGCGIHVLISQHRDGEIITRIVRELGFGVVRGSSTRGGMRAVRELSRHAAHSHLAITPDGPRGPRRELHDGVIYVAARTGLPIVPVGFAFDRPWRAASWDQFILPRPFSRAVWYGGTPVCVPPLDEPSDLLVQKRRIAVAIEQAMQRATELLGVDERGCPLAAPADAEQAFAAQRRAA